MLQTKKKLISRAHGIHFYRGEKKDEEEMMRSLNNQTGKISCQPKLNSSPDFF